MNFSFLHSHGERHSVLNPLLEALAFLPLCASFLAVTLRYKDLPDRIPDLFAIGAGAVSKTYLLYLFALHVVVYLLLTLFQVHPEWRMYPTKLLPLIRSEQARKALYSFNSLFLLIAKAEAAFTFGMIILGAILEKDVAIPTAAMLIIMLFTLVLFKTDTPKLKA